MERKNATNNIAPALMNVQFLSAAEGSILPNVVIARIPITEAIRLTIAIIIGNAMYSKRKVAALAPITMAAIIEPQYDSKISAPRGDPDWVAVNVILEEKLVRDIVPDLKAIGVEDIASINPFAN